MLVNEPAKADAQEIRKMEEYVEHWFHLACRGLVKENGNPYLLQSAVFLKAIGNQIKLAKIPTIVQNAIVTPLALTGKLLGYKRSYYE